MEHWTVEQRKHFETWAEKQVELLIGRRVPVSFVPIAEYETRCGTTTVGMYFPKEDYIVIKMYPAPDLSDPYSGCWEIFVYGWYLETLAHEAAHAKLRGVRLRRGQHLHNRQFWQCCRELADRAQARLGRFSHVAPPEVAALFPEYDERAWISAVKEQAETETGTTETEGV